MNKVLIIDGHNLAHRARHRFAKFSNSEGLSSSVVFGGPFIVSSLIRRFPNDLTYVVFDGGRAKERMEALPEYKAGRDREDNDQFFKQMEDFKKILNNLNVRVIWERHEEADDFIYTLGKVVHRTTHKTIVSSDKDFIPMLDPWTKIFNPFKDKIITTENCKKLYGFSHTEFLDYLILKGDKSDNISGVPGLGDKRIRQLLDEFGSIDDYLEQCTGGIFDKYWEDIDAVNDRNHELINLRYFHNKYRRNHPVSYWGEPTYNPQAVKVIAHGYGIRVFNDDKFLKPFRELG